MHCHPQEALAPIDDFLVLCYRFSLFFVDIVTSSIQPFQFSVKCFAEAMKCWDIEYLNIGTSMLTEIPLQTTNQLVKAIWGIRIPISLAYL